MEELQAANISIPIFDYSRLDKETAEYLQDRYNDMKRHYQKARYEIACELAKAHDRLAKNRYGCFYEWCESIGFNKEAVKKELRFYDLIGSAGPNRTLIEKLPKRLQDDIARPSAPEELKQKVFNGEIKTPKEWEEEKESMQKRLAEAEEQAKQAKQENAALTEQYNAQAKELQDLKDNPTVVETPADPEYIVRLENEAAKAKAEAKKANRDYEMLQDRFEDLNKKAGDLMRERDENAKMAEEIAGELKQSQELNNRLIAERGQTDSETEIVAVLATAARQITDENMAACVQHILSLNDGQAILARFRAMLEV